MDNKPKNNGNNNVDDIDEILRIMNNGRSTKKDGSSKASGGIQPDVSFSAVPTKKVVTDKTSPSPTDETNADDTTSKAQPTVTNSPELASKTPAETQEIPEVKAPATYKKGSNDVLKTAFNYEVVDSVKASSEVKTPVPQDATRQLDAVKKQPENVKPVTEATKVDMDRIKAPQSAKKTTEADKPAEKTAPIVKKSEVQNTSVASSGVSLDDFNTEPEDTKAKKKRKNDDIQVTFLGSVKFGIIKLVAYIAFVLLCCYIISSTVIKVGNDVFAFVKDDTEITVTIPDGATTKDIAKILDAAGVIDHPFVFEKYAEFRISKRSYLTGKYLTGDITVNPMMNFDTLINTLSDYERSVQGTVRITIPEGLTVDETLELFETKGVGKKAEFLEALQNFEYDYKFMEGLVKGSISDYRFDTDMSYRLEGYLFPDTYDFYINENPISAIDKLLTNFNRKFESEFYDRCAKLGMTVDEVIILASLIEKEGNNAEDYYYISSVFHNRLNNSASHPFLNSDATIQYALHERAGLYNIDTSMNHPYNTYNNKGLPPGPICNPGIEAIYAALYPEKTSYYYFYTKKNGETVYSKTYEQHQKYVNADKASN